MFIWCIQLNYKQYDNFEGHKISFVGLHRKGFFLGHLVDFLYSLGLEFIVLGVSHMCKKKIM
jgi:hypothetical protein